MTAIIFSDPAKRKYWAEEVLSEGEQLTIFIKYNLHSSLDFKPYLSSLLFPFEAFKENAFCEVFKSDDTDFTENTLASHIKKGISFDLSFKNIDDYIILRFPVPLTDFSDVKGILFEINVFDFEIDFFTFSLELNDGSKFFTVQDIKASQKLCVLDGKGQLFVSIDCFKGISKEQLKCVEAVHFEISPVNFYTNKRKYDISGVSLVKKDNIISSESDIIEFDTLSSEKNPLVLYYNNDNVLYSLLKYYEQILAEKNFILEDYYTFTPDRLEQFCNLIKSPEADARLEIIPQHSKTEIKLNLLCKSFDDYCILRFISLEENWSMYSGLLLNIKISNIEVDNLLFSIESLSGKKVFAKKDIILFQRIYTAGEYKLVYIPFSKFKNISVEFLEKVEAFNIEICPAVSPEAERKYSLNDIRLIENEKKLIEENPDIITFSDEFIKKKVFQIDHRNIQYLKTYFSQEDKNPLNIDVKFSKKKNLYFSVTFDSMLSRVEKDHALILALNTKEYTDDKIYMILNGSTKKKKNVRYKAYSEGISESLKSEKIRFLEFPLYEFYDEEGEDINFEDFIINNIEIELIGVSKFNKMRKYRIYGIYYSKEREEYSDLRSFSLKFIKRKYPNIDFFISNSYDFFKDSKNNNKVSLRKYGKSIIPLSDSNMMNKMKKVHFEKLLYNNINIFTKQSDFCFSFIKKLYDKIAAKMRFILIYKWDKKTETISSMPLENSELPGSIFIEERLNRLELVFDEDINENNKLKAFSNFFSKKSINYFISELTENLMKIKNCERPNINIHVMDNDSLKKILEVLLTLRLNIQDRHFFINDIADIEFTIKNNFKLNDKDLKFCKLAGVKCIYFRNDITISNYNKYGINLVNERNPY